MGARSSSVSQTHYDRHTDTLDWHCPGLISGTLSSSVILCHQSFMAPVWLMTLNWKATTCADSEQPRLVWVIIWLYWSACPDWLFNSTLTSFPQSYDPLSPCPPWGINVLYITLSHLISQNHRLESAVHTLSYIIIYMNARWGSQSWNVRTSTTAEITCSLMDFLLPLSLNICHQSTLADWIL